MARDFSNDNLGALWVAQEEALKCAGQTPEDVDFETLAAIVEERKKRNKPVAPLKVLLRQDSEMGKRFATAYRTARQTYPHLPKLIGWKGDGVEYVPTFEKRFGRR